MAKQTERPTVHKLEAIKTKQNGITMYVGVAPAGQLIDVTRVDPYDPKLPPTDTRQGYQRPPEKSRITRIGSFLAHGDGLKIFPTAVLLAARHPLEFEKLSGTISVSSDEPLQIVDGQHRIEGLKYVVEKKGLSEYAEFPVPFVVMETPEKRIEMEQFRIVNGTAKSVRTDLVNMILTATYADVDRADVPTRDQWKIVVSNVVDRLAKAKESPWRGQIILPGESGGSSDGNEKVVRATSFITSLKPVYVWLKETILDQECRTLEEEIDYMFEVVVAFWSALKAVVPGAFDEPDQHVIQKTPGLFSLHKLLKHLLGNMYKGRREFDAETFEEFLAESSELVDANFWHVDEKRASVYGSMKGFEELYYILSEAYR